MNYYFCLRKSDYNCPKTLLGQIACDNCKENSCKNCGRVNTSFCLTCENSGLTETMKERLREHLLKRRK